MGPSLKGLPYFEDECGLECLQSENNANFFIDMISAHPELTQKWKDREEAIRNGLIKRT
jgi:hypothetical protein